MEGGLVMDGFTMRHLAKLKELATNFDKNEREVVLSCIPVEEIQDYLKKLENKEDN